jgi:hypothetical protein
MFSRQVEVTTNDDRFQGVLQVDQPHDHLEVSFRFRFVFWLQVTCNYNDCRGQAFLGEDGCHCNDQERGPMLLQNWLQVFDLVGGNDEHPLIGRGRRLDAEEVRVDF